jgi:transcriptional regulator with XRE-family HTH domain
MGKLWDVVQAHMDGEPYRVSQRQVALKLGISPTALGNWRQLRSLPEADHLRALANLTGTPYLRVLDAALEDAGYLPKAGGDHDEPRDTAPSTQAGGSPAGERFVTRRPRRPGTAPQQPATPRLPVERGATDRV